MSDIKGHKGIHLYVMYVDPTDNSIFEDSISSSP